MSIASLDTEVRQLPNVELLPPRPIEKMTPPAELLGLEPDEAPSYVLHARGFAEAHAKSPVAWTRLAQAEQSAGNHAAAVDAAAKAVELAQNQHTSGAAALTAAALVARVDPSRFKNVFEDWDHPFARVSSAAAAIENDDVAAAIGFLQGVDSPSARSLRAYCYVRIGRYQEAVAEYRTARRMGSNSLEVLVNQGFALSQLGSTEKAIRLTREATLRAPTNAIASYNLARYLISISARETAARELDRLAAARPWDAQSVLYQAWSHVDLPDGARDALRILSRAKAKFRDTIDPVTRADIDSSIVYLNYQVGRTSKEKTRQRLWQIVRGVEYGSIEGVRMLLSLLDRREHLAELRLLVAEVGELLRDADRLLALSKIELLSGNLEMATELAIDASQADAPAKAGAAATAAYLVGEVRGDYARAAELAEPAYRRNPDSGLTNNYAFSLVLARRPREALTILSKFDRFALPYHGATVGLALLALGRIDEGMAVYEEAESLVRQEGDETTADYIAVRAGLALRQFNIDRPEASDEYLEARWPRDRNEGRWAVLCQVANRVGVNVATCK